MSSTRLVGCITMPNLPKRPCSHPGCSVLVQSGRCPKHARQAQEARGTTAQRGYDAAWKRLRVLCFERDEWRCIECGWEPAEVSAARESGIERPLPAVLMRALARAFARGERHLHADHDLPIQSRPDLRLDLANLRTLCNVCHSRKTAREDGGFGREGGSQDLDGAGRDPR